ncbi:C39 family peptidase [Belnapia sp. T6]|uniref:C39 family peptidase n=1 Tax=Belnapia mucosa TaxID=2804532 RepID=A0ABS1VF59_9PROT|nr:C39 family peptidase [Belnapia mucosa]MBL6459379.1 C39 family peptidase [Belnapia mucosa]
MSDTPTGSDSPTDLTQSIQDIAQPSTFGSPPTESSLLDSLQNNQDHNELQLDRGTASPVSPALVGDPERDAQHWQHQDTGFTCAIVAQLGIIETFTGTAVTEAQLVYDATVNGWLTDAGTYLPDMGKLLDKYGVPNHTKTDATIEDLVAELAAGHRVIVTIDSGELWGADGPLDPQIADHAIWVTGMDLSDPANPKVIINDSGDPNGGGKSYDLRHFADSWSRGGYAYVATDQAPPDYQITNADFDPAQGRIPALTEYFEEAHPGFASRVDAANDYGTLGGRRYGADAASLPPASSPLEELQQADRDALFRAI